jgi:hypothetical protein
VIRNVVSMTSSAGTCSGQGSVTVTADARRQTAGDGVIYRKDVDVDFAPCVGVDFPVGSAMYLVGIDAPEDQEVTISCSNGATWQSDFMSPVVGWLPSYGAPSCSDGVTRLLESGGGRMAGTYSGPCTGCCPRVEFSWSICRAGIACPPPPPLPTPEPTPEPRRPCDETAPDRAQLDLLLDQWGVYAGRVRRATAEVEEIQRQAVNWQGDFTDAMRDCRLWGAAQILVGLLTSGVVAGQPAQFSAFVNYGAQLDKIASGDPTWLLPSDNMTTRGLDWNSVENYYDAFNYAYGNLGESAPAELRERLQGCGAPTLNETLDGAYAYLRLMEELGSVARRMHEAANDLRDHEEKIFDFCASHPDVCADYERCRQQGGGR